MEARERVVGRDDELAAVRRVVEQARRGLSNLLVVEGEAGIGKSTILDAGVRDAQGVILLRARGRELERDRPFGLVASMLGPPAADLVRSEAPPGDTASPTAAVAWRWRIAEALVELAQQRRASLLLAVDDLQWADEGSALVLEVLALESAAAACSLVAAMRPPPWSPHVAALAQALERAGGTRLVVPPLAEASVLELASTIVGGPPAPRLRAALDRGGGNPMLVLEVVRGLEREGALVETAGGMVETLAERPAKTLADAVVRRLRALPEAVVELLRAAAVLGESFTVADVAALGGRSPSETARLLTRAVDDGLLRSDGMALAFRHDLLREGVELALPLPLSATLHREAARLLQARGAAPAVVAHHLAAAGIDDDAIAWLATEAGDLAASAPALAAELLEAAVRAVPRSDARWPALAAQLAAALVWSGRMPDGIELARAALAAGLDAPRERVLVPLVTRTLAAVGQIDQALACLGQSRAVSIPARARLAGEAAFTRLWRGDLDRAEEDARLVEGAATRGFADSDTLCLLAAVRTGIAVSRGQLADACRRAAETLARAAAPLAEPTNVPLAEAVAASAFLYADELPRARGLLASGERRAEETGAPWLLPMYRAHLGLAALWAGELEVALGHLDPEVTGGHPLPAAGSSLFALGRARPGCSASKRPRDRAGRACTGRRDGGEPRRHRPRVAPRLAVVVQGAPCGGGRRPDFGDRSGRAGSRRERTGRSRIDPSSRRAGRRPPPPCRRRRRGGRERKPTRPPSCRAGRHSVRSGGRAARARSCDERRGRTGRGVRRV